MDLKASNKVPAARPALRRLAVLLPCFNEEAALPHLLEELNRLRLELEGAWDLAVLVVDDGSADGTAAIAGAEHGGLPLQLIRHEENRGLGAALATGIRWFLEQEDGAEGNALAVLDADGTHPPELLKEMLARLEGEAGTKSRPTMACDVVIASRYAPGGAEHGLPLTRRLYSRVASAVLSLVARVRGVRDYTCGYRLYRGAVLQKATAHYGESLITERGFVCMAELLIKLGRTGARVCEAPLELHYELKRGPSKMNVPATIKRYAVLAWRILFDPRFR
ncbi:glycosyltransferase family 2 protein [bacterium]|nr:glycosyltransferase family 2 protein [bacterium]